MGRQAKVASVIPDCSHTRQPPPPDSILGTPPPLPHTHTHSLPRVLQVVRHERASIKADIWSYGILIWELITGEDITEYQPLSISRQVRRAQRRRAAVDAVWRCVFVWGEGGRGGGMQAWVCELCR